MKYLIFYCLFFEIRKSCIKNRIIQSCNLFMHLLNIYFKAYTLSTDFPFIYMIHICFADKIFYTLHML